MSCTWHSFTKEWAEATFDIEPHDEHHEHDEQVTLTVIDDGFDPGSAVLQNWPKILSALKSRPEHGKPAPRCRQVKRNPYTLIKDHKGKRQENPK